MRSGANPPILYLQHHVLSVGRNIPVISESVLHSSTAIAVGLVLGLGNGGLPTPTRAGRARRNRERTSRTWSLTRRPGITDASYVHGNGRAEFRSSPRVTRSPLMDSFRVAETRRLRGVRLPADPVSQTDKGDPFHHCIQERRADRDNVLRSPSRTAWG